MLAPRMSVITSNSKQQKPYSNFRRVLPLPTENWTDFADIWFCHNHQSNGKPHDHIHHSHSGGDTLPAELKKVKVSGFTPRPEDCLVSSLYMLVSARQVESCAVLCTTDRIICKRCGNFLGFVKLGGEFVVRFHVFLWISVANISAVHNQQQFQMKDENNTLTQSGFSSQQR